MIKKILYFLLFLLLSCEKNQTHSYSFYYWRTHLQLNTAEKTALKNAPYSYLYTRFFDIEKVNGKFQPIGVITKDATFQTTKTIVPVVFIKNEVFYGINLEEINFLAKNISTLIQKKQKEFNFKKSQEIQIDCDWTAGTNKEYFAFLEKLKEITGLEITCTLRLHQVKNSALSGIPPVDKVYLMCYSTSSPLENSTNNSILEVQTLKNYLSRINRYPLDVEIALPIFSWGIITNHLGKHKLINALSTKHLNRPEFKKISETEAEVLIDGFYFGTYLNKGFHIKVEEISEQQLSDVKKYLDTKLSSYRIIYYHLDDQFLENRKL